MSENIPSNVINRYFSKETDISNDIRRALLTIGVNGNMSTMNIGGLFGTLAMQIRDV